MLYTVTTTSFNDEFNLPRFIENMEGQTVPPVEIIVADGGSKDNTLSILHELAEKSNIHIKIISGQRLNIAQGFNEAIRAAETEYVFVAGIGNEFEPDCIELLIKNSDKGDMIYPPIRSKGNNRFEKEYVRTFLHGEDGKDDKVSLNHGVLIKKRVFEDVGYFYEKFVYAGEDSEFYALAQRKGYKSYCVKEAKLYWEIPKSIKEFKKQIMVYQIGAMQIYSKEFMIKVNRRAFATVLALIVALAGMLLLRNTYVTIAILGVITLIILKRKLIDCRDCSYFLNLINRYYGLMCLIRNRKYMKDEYSVKR